LEITNKFGSRNGTNKATKLIYTKFKSSFKHSTQQLEHLQAAVSGIPAESIVILLINEQLNGHPRIKFFNMDWL
jgi:hypothetical protein